MPNINAVLNDQIRRLSRREIRANTKTIKRATGHYRRDIAALKRQVAQLLRQMTALRKQAPQQPLTAPPEVIQNARLRIDGLKSHRARLGLSAKDYGRLMGVSGLTIYHWEAGKSKPRRSHLPKIVAVRGIGKREAMERLGMNGKAVDTEAEPAAKPKSSKPEKRRKFSQTGEEMILGLLKGRKTLGRRDINAAWTKEGRSGTADVTLGMMVEAKKLKRVKVEGLRGSGYRVG
jgi:DNA-binding transcriptional regulator YiaG